MVMYNHSVGKPERADDLWLLPLGCVSEFSMVCVFIKYYKVIIFNKHTIIVINNKHNYNSLTMSCRENQSGWNTWMRSLCLVRVQWNQERVEGWREAFTEEALSSDPQKSPKNWM